MSEVAMKVLIAVLLVLGLAGCDSATEPVAESDPQLSIADAAVTRHVVSSCTVNAPGGDDPCEYNHDWTMSVRNTGGKGRFQVRAEYMDGSRRVASETSGPHAIGADELVGVEGSRFTGETRVNVVLTLELWNGGGYVKVGSVTPDVG